MGTSIMKTNCSLGSVTTTHFLNLYIMRLDYKQTFPEGMEEYLGFYGWHFSKKMCEWASKKMYKGSESDRRYITPYTREGLDELLKRANITLRSNKGYDDVYVANMCMADFLGSSIRTEMDLAKYVKDVIEDPDAYEGMVFTRFYADCIGSGTPISWKDML